MNHRNTNKPHSRPKTDRTQNRKATPRPTTDAARTPSLKGLVPLSGLHAIDAVFRYHPSVVQAFYYSSARADQVAEAAQFLKQSGKTAQALSAPQLERLADTPQHDGVVALTQRSPLKPLSPKQAHSLAKEGHPLLIIDGETTQIETGELVRSAVYYGIAHIILADSPLERITQENAYRIARGGLDIAELHKAKDLPAFIKQLRNSYYVMAADYEGEALLEYTALCPAEELGKPLALVLPASDQGLRPEVKKNCHTTVAFPGSDTLDRLSLAAETAILLQKYIAEGV